MAALTRDRNTFRRNGDEFTYTVADGVTVFAGSMVCLKDGKAVPASVATDLTPVVGVAQHQAKGGTPVLVRRGVFNFDAVSNDAPTLQNVGSLCYAADDATVKLAIGSPAAPVAGIVLDVDDAGVWIKL